MNQATIVRRAIRWDLISRRLKTYPAIALSFPESLLRNGEAKPPFYCHYMAWRLGTWRSDEPFERLERSLVSAAALPGWETKRELFASCEFGAFWSLLWELEVALGLARLGCDVSWGKSGPDLQVRRNNETAFVECYVYRKHFDAMEYIQEVLTSIHPRLILRHSLNRPVRIPFGKARSQFFHDLFAPIVDRESLKRLEISAKIRYPVLVPTPAAARNITVVMEGGDPGVYEPGRVPFLHGDAQDYVQVAVREIIGNKGESNRIAEYRPNILMANLLLSQDFQGAVREASMSAIERAGALSSGLDGVILCVCGIDCEFDRDSARIQLRGQGANWLFDWLHSQWSAG